MRFTNLLSTLSALTLGTAAVTTGCMGETGGDRKPGRTGDSPTPGDGSGSADDCAKVEKDVVIKTTADMASLPTTGCYDLYGKLTIQGGQVTSLAGLHGLNSVNELDLDHTALTAIDTKGDVGIYGKLTVTGNAKLANLAKLSFVGAATGILVDSNPLLATINAIDIDDPALTEVDGDIAITGNAALTAVPFKHLTKVTGAVTISNNTQLKSIDLTALASTGHVEIADNTQLSSLSGFAATTINGDLAIRNNDALTTLGTMSSLFRVTGNLTIDGNATLTNLAAFTTTIKYVDAALTITNNPVLTDLGSLKHLALVGGITISNNQKLLVCRATEVDRCTSHPTTAVIANNNNASCNWQCN